MSSQELHIGHHTLLNADCLDALPALPPSSVNLVVTSPPYNVGLDYGDYDDGKSHADYLDFLRLVFVECHRVLAPDGRACINIGDGRNGRIPTHAEVIAFMRDLGFRTLSTVIWNKRTTSNRAAWGSFMSPSNPSFPSTFEYVLMFGKSDGLAHSGTATVSRDEFVAWTNPMWEFKPETNLREIGHPAAFPVELPLRCIKMLSYQEDVVLDPFMGSGTTGIACIETARRFIGIELDPKHFATAAKRIARKKKAGVQQELFSTPYYDPNRP